MNRLFGTGFSGNGLSSWLLLLRIAIGIFMLTHGLPKLSSLVSGEIQFMDPFGIGVKTSLALTVFAEVGCSALLILGLATRLATIPLIITMLVAVFIAHGSDPFGKKEMALLYLLVYITILVTGPGKFSIDALIGGRPNKR